MEAVTIRPAVPEDAPALLAIYAPRRSSPGASAAFWSGTPI